MGRTQQRRRACLLVAAMLTAGFGVTAGTEQSPAATDAQQKGQQSQQQVYRQHDNGRGRGRDRSGHQIPTGVAAAHDAAYATSSRPSTSARPTCRTRRPGSTPNWSPSAVLRDRTADDQGSSVTVSGGRSSSVRPGATVVTR